MILAHESQPCPLDQNQDPDPDLDQDLEDPDLDQDVDQDGHQDLACWFMKVNPVH